MVEFKKLFFLIFFLGISQQALTQTDAPSPLKANRPGVSESPGLAIPGALQVESGYSLRKNQNNGIEIINYTYREPLITPI